MGLGRTRLLENLFDENVSIPHTIHSMGLYPNKLKSWHFGCANSSACLGIHLVLISFCMKFCFFLGLLTIIPCFAVAPGEQPVSPDILDELKQAESDLEIAEKMYVPYYAGSLLSPASTTVPKGMVIVQPYLFLESGYGTYEDHRKLSFGPHYKAITFSCITQIGLNDFMDLVLINPAGIKWQNHQFSGGYGDTQVTVGFNLLKQTMTYPSIRFSIGETFPTGHYNNLNLKKQGIDATGKGAYTTAFSVVTGKVFWWNKLHPLNTRLALIYKISAPTHIKGASAYGGSKGSRGKIYPGNGLTIDVSTELSLNQKWVFANDIYYTYQRKSRFSGTAGDSKPGLPLSDNLSFLPTIEYNPNNHSAWLLGVWFSVMGRNSTAFVQLIGSYYIAF